MAGDHRFNSVVTWCTTAGDETRERIPRAKWSYSVRILGAWVTFDNSFSKEVRFRIGQSWKAFSVHRDTLCNAKSSLKKRLSLWDRVVLPSLAWGSRSWNPTLKLFDEIWSTQHNMIKAMLRTRKSGCCHALA